MERPVTNTRAPELASSLAMPRPTPAVPPVTTAILFARVVMFSKITTLLVELQQRPEFAAPPCGALQIGAPRCPWGRCVAASVEWWVCDAIDANPAKADRP